MLYKTHIVSSIALGTGVALITDYPYSVDYLAGIAIGSLLPDIDEPKSYIGQKSFGIAKLVKKIFGHRGVTHSLFAWLVVTIICFMFPMPFTLGIAAGYLFHIIGDLFSISGVPLFLPFLSWKVRMPLKYRTGSKVEQFIYFISVSAIIYLVITKKELWYTLWNSIVEWIHILIKIITNI